MIPRASQGVSHIATRIMGDLISRAPDAYMAADLAYIAALLGMIGQDYDRAAEVLTSEHQAICVLLRRAEGHIAEADLKARIAGALSLEAASLRIPDLNARGDAVMKVLIDVHAAVEEGEARGEIWAGPLDLEIWNFLEGFVANRAYEVAF